MQCHQYDTDMTSVTKSLAHGYLHYESNRRRQFNSEGREPTVMSMCKQNVLGGYRKELLFICKASWCLNNPYMKSPIGKKVPPIIVQICKIKKCFGP